MDNLTRQFQITHLSGLVTPARLARMNEVLAQRTRHIAVVLEDIYQGHNASAVLRTCDCFGVQEVHVVEGKNTFTVSQDIALGSAQWLDLHKYREAEKPMEACMEKLRARGFRIVATTPHAKGKTIRELDVTTPVALVFGTELKGLRQETIDAADDWVRIPMYGFTESYNISVSAALCLYELTERMRASDIHWQISDTDREALLLEWLKHSIHRSDDILREFSRKAEEKGANG